MWPRLRSEAGSRRFAIELVIQTASGVLTGRFGPREAVTLLASQAPQARSEARALAGSDPDRSQEYAQLLSSIGAELDSADDPDGPPPDLRSVIEELERVVEALTPEGPGTG